MSKNVSHIQHVKSNVVENGLPKLPSASVIVEGEIAVNYADGFETLSIKSSSGNIVTFSSDDYYSEKKLGYKFIGENSANTVSLIIDEDEEIVAAALNDLDERKLDASAYTPTDLSNYYTKDETSGATELEEAFSAKTDQVWIEDKLGSGFTDENSANTVTKVIEDNEKVISAALNDLESRKLDASAYTPTDLSNYYTKDETSGATELEEAFSNYYTKDETSGATELEEAFSGKADVEYVEEIEIVTAAALNDLDDRKMDISAYTPTDLSNYYTKDETSGATELEEAFSAKTDQIWIEDKLGEYFTSGNSANTVTSVIRDDELVTSAALNDLDERKLDASAYTPTDLTNYYTKSETSGASEISTALGTKVNSQTFISHTGDSVAHVTSAERDVWDAKASVTWVEDRLGSGFTGENSGITVTEIIEENEEIISTALNDLDTRKLDASAYTPTDLTNYYTKSETSGATEISTALGVKENALAIDSTAKTSSFSAEVGKYYIVNVPNDGRVTVTLPTSTSTYVQSIVFLVTLGTGMASIAFTPIAFKTEGFDDITAGNTYEVNALWNGTNWIMAMTKLEAVV